jgi:hypothetical protein
MSGHEGDKAPSTLVLRGCPVPVGLAHLLAYVVDDPALTFKLERAIELQVRALALDDHEVDTILAALEEPPEGLEELRRRLLSERRR